MENIKCSNPTSKVAERYSFNINVTFYNEILNMTMKSLVFGTFLSQLTTYISEASGAESMIWVSWDVQPSLCVHSVCCPHTARGYSLGLISVINHQYLDLHNQCCTSFAHPHHSYTSSSMRKQQTNVSLICIVSWGSLLPAFKCFICTVLLCIHRCNGKRTCSMRASSGMLGDTCPRMYKYLELTYNCLSKQLKG